ncbi:MAG: HD-GYP domain-containing protein [Clostridium sp.]|nr:HD-GYP domain-containing protein [Clostridium sp.]
MAKLLLSTYELKTGMMLGETVLNNYGAVIVSEGTILDEYIIRKLGNLELPKIKVICEENNIPLRETSDAFNMQYSKNMDSIRNIICDLEAGKGIDVGKINRVAESVILKASERKDIVRCLNQIKLSGEYLYTHSINVSLLSMLLGKWLGYKETEIKKLVIAGLLHDVGKTRVSSKILNKPGKLTEEEYNEIKKHAVYGYRILENEKNMDKDVSHAVLMHHEREDGSGYPMGIKGEKISKLAKVIAVADIYDAMTSNRVYKERESAFEVFRMMERESIGKLDIKVVNALLSNIASYFVGDFAKLNDGRVCEIVYINPRFVSSPIINIDGGYIDLSEDTDLIIEEIL